MIRAEIHFLTVTVLIKRVILRASRKEEIKKEIKNLKTQKNGKEKKILEKKILQGESTLTGALM